MSFYDDQPLNLSYKDLKREPESPPRHYERYTPPEDYQVPFYDYPSPVTPVNYPFYRRESVDSWHASSTSSPPPTDSISDDDEYKEYEKVAMAALTQGKGGSLTGSNPRMRRIVQGNNTTDEDYRRQRERNNRAAKESRDRRKLKEVKKSIQVAFLEAKLSEMKAQLEEQRCKNCLLL